jgi:murein DD-endopeptidase MepM/ murein hydrolase activator NlpD
MAIGTVQSSVNGRRTGGIAPLARNFYNLTRRPAARLGNGNISPLFPLSIPAAITSAFGWRIHPISGDYRFHSGTDMGAPMGTPVLAAYAGRVSIADFMRGYGLTVVMQHNSQHHPQHAATAQTLYAHLSELFVQSGEWVEQGEVIGRVGSTGNSTGPHLHFEFRELTPQGWQALDPGQMLEYSLAQLIQSLQTAQAVPLPQPPEQPVRVQPEAPIDRALSQRQHRNQDRNA